MTDNEIIKALECCACGYCYRDGCPLANDDGYDDDISKCTSKLSENALDLVNRQRAEIERLHSEVKEKTETIVFLKDQAVGWSIDFCNLKAKLDTAKSEAIKEFAERLRDVAYIPKPYGMAEVVDMYTIDNLVKEMTEHSDVP